MKKLTIADFQNWGSQGGKAATGDKKRRGDSDYYRAMVAKRQKKKKAQA